MLETAGAPVIVFAKGVNNLDKLAEIKCDVIGLDWTIDIGAARAAIGTRKALQGNLDPFLLTTTPEIIGAETKRVLEEMRGRTGHIFNLGHGILPETPVENVIALVQEVHSYSKKDKQSMSPSVAF